MSALKAILQLTSVKKLFGGFDKLSFGEAFKAVFFCKAFGVFALIFLLGSVFLFFQYSDILKTFALEEKNFSITQLQGINPANAITEKFTCQSEFADCNEYSYVTIALLLILEIFTIFSVAKYRKKLAKKTLFTLPLFMQSFLLIIILVFSLAPQRTLSALNKQANEDIQSAVGKFNNGQTAKGDKIMTDLTRISNKIRLDKELPVLIEENPKEQFILQTLSIDLNKKDSIYRASIIPYKVYFSPETVPLKKKLDKEFALFPDNVLIVNKVSREVIREMASSLAKKMVEEEYPQYVKKQDPAIDVPEKKAYLDIRQKENEKIKREYLNHIESTKENIANNQSAVAKNEENIAAIDKEYESYKSSGDEWIANCEEKFRKGSAVCEKGADAIASNLQNLIENKNENKKANENIKLYISESHEYLSLSQKQYEEFLKNPVIPEAEAGVFIPPNKIHIKYAKGSTEKFSAYLKTVTHEYLHYLSGNQGENFPGFLNEWLTDYFTGNLVKNYLKVKNVFGYLGYPNGVEIIESIVKFIPEEKLTTIYFSKNKPQFRIAFNDSFKNITYADFEIKSEQMFYSSLSDPNAQAALTRDIINSLSGK